MQRFINNWSSALASSASATDAHLSIDPADAAKLIGLNDGGFYQLTLVGYSTTDGVITENAWEIIKITAAEGGVLTVERGLEGTAVRDWAAGTLVALRVTANLLGSILSRLVALEGTEVPPDNSESEVVLAVTVGDSTNGALGWSSYGGFPESSCDPISFSLPAPIGEVSVTDIYVRTVADDWSPRAVLLCIAHEFTMSQLASIQIEGIGTFQGAEALQFEFSNGESVWQWAFDASDWAAGEVRAVTLVFNP